MKSFVRRAAVTGTSLALAVGAAAALAPSAGAAVPRSSSAHAAPAVAARAAAYNGVCGAGYTVVNSAPIVNDDGVRLGVVYLTYNGGTGDNCVVTVRTSPGAAVPMYAILGNTRTGENADDTGTCTTYAGPIYVHARGTCVTCYGMIDGTVAGKAYTNCAAVAR